MNEQRTQEQEPAYRYGFEMAADWRYRSREWDDVDDGLRLGWEMEHDTPWEAVKGVARQGWRLAKDEMGEAAEFGPDFDETLRGFREHYDTVYGGSANAYDPYHPAYLYGFFMAGEETYSDWNEAEPHIREHWQQMHDEDWEEVSDAALFGWNYVRRGV